MHATALLVLALPLLAARPLTAQSGTSAATTPAAPAEGVTIAGVVHDSAGGLLTGATVRVRRVQGSVEVGAWSAQTDATGRFRVHGLPVGDYQVSAELAGYGSTMLTLAPFKGAGQIATIRLRLGRYASLVGPALGDGEFGPAQQQILHTRPGVRDSTRDTTRPH